MPLVKVIVPCYNYAAHLADCVESVLDQAGVEVRVLIVDDCSPDETPEVGRRLAAADDRVEYRRHERNVGLVPTANEGLEWAADGDYTVIISADDLLVPGALQRATSVMEAHPRVGLVYGRAVQFASGQPADGGGARAWAGTRIWSDEGWIRLPLPRADRWRGTKVWSGEDWIRIRCRSGHGCISSPEAVVRTSVQREAGFYDPAAGHMSEVNMWLRVAAISDVAYIKGAQALYRIHTESMSRTMLTDVSGPLVEIADRRTAFESFFAGPGGRLPDAVGLRDTVRRTLARQALWRASRAYDRGAVRGPEGRSAEDLVAFALETYPRARRLREWWGLRLRRRIGAGRSLWFPLFPLTGAAHRLRAHYNRFRLHARGI